MSGRFITIKELKINDEDWSRHNNEEGVYVETEDDKDIDNAIDYLKLPEGTKCALFTHAESGCVTRLVGTFKK